MCHEHLLKEGDEVFRAPPGVAVYSFPIIVVGPARTRVQRDCTHTHPPRISVTNWKARTAPAFNCQQKPHSQFTLDPPPKHCPHGTTSSRPPSASVFSALWNRTVVDVGARCERYRAGWMCARSSRVGGPASRTRMVRVGEAAARRPASRQPAVPPGQGQV